MITQKEIDGISSLSCTRWPLLIVVDNLMKNEAMNDLIREIIQNDKRYDHCCFGIPSCDHIAYFCSDRQAQQELVDLFIELALPWSIVI